MLKIVCEPQLKSVYPQQPPEKVRGGEKHGRWQPGTEHVPKQGGNLFETTSDGTQSCILSFLPAKIA